MSLNSLTLIQSIEGLAKKTFSSVELAQSCLDQINNHSELNAFLTLNPNLLAEAQVADNKRSQANFNSDDPANQLLGIPLAIKDNILTKNIETTASSKVLSGFKPPFSATVINKLTQSGALILGKTNMDAWAHGSSTETSDFGPTKNPWNLEHLPGGSSGGSAAAVAADLCVAAIGTETAGSIRQPAAWCGVTGFKPTYGRVSRFGIVSMASSTDQAGPLTKTVEDSILLLNLLSGHDVLDATTMPEPPLKINFDTPTTLTGKTIGLPDEYILSAMDPRVINVINDAVKVFESLGAKVVPIHLLDPKYSISVYTILQRSEVSSNLARYDGIRYGNDRSNFGEEAKRRMLLGSYALSTGYYDQYYKKSQKVRTLIVNDFNTAFSQVDAVIGPVSPGPALKIGASKNQPMFGEMEDILVEASSIAGLTSTSIPCGFVDGLPIGMQVTGPQKSEDLVAKLSLSYQHATNWHLQKPSSLKSMKGNKA